MEYSAIYIHVILHNIVLFRTRSIVLYIHTKMILQVAIYNYTKKTDIYNIIYEDLVYFKLNKQLSVEKSRTGKS